MGSGEWVVGSGTDRMVREMRQEQPTERSGGAAGASVSGAERSRLRWAMRGFGVLLLLCGAAYLVSQYWESPAERARRVFHLLSRTRSNMRSMETGIESYFVDYGVYPAHTTIASRSDLGVAGDRWPTFRLRNEDQVVTLTTPVNYLGDPRLPDPFGKPRGRSFCYFAAGDGWIMWSPGPDEDYDIDPRGDYDPAGSEPSEALLKVTFDPTNGTVSPGDIWRVRQ